MSDGSNGSLTSLIRPIASVHESVTADRILRQLRERRSHQALVVDEFGGTAGLLTLEDVLAELVGDVGDEFKPADPVAEELADGSMRLPGGMAVDDAATALRTVLESDASSVGAWSPKPRPPAVAGESSDRRLRVRSGARGRSSR